MRSGRLFWGAFFLGAGSLLLLSRFDLAPSALFLPWRWWPLILVFFGSAVLVRSDGAKTALVLLAALTSCLVVAGLLSAGSRLFGHDTEPDAEFHQLFVEPLDSGIRSALLTIDLDAGVLAISRSDSSLFRAVIESHVTSYGFRSDRLGDRTEIDLHPREYGWQIGHSVRNEIDVRLHGDVEWDLQLTSDASRIDADLSDLNLKSVNVDADAASIDLKLGGPVSKSVVRINVDASAVRIRIPVAAACEITVNADLSETSLPGFESVEPGLYRTADSDTTYGLISIEIESDASSVRVDRH